MSAYQACPTAKLENLLLATDGSKASEGAVRESFNMAKMCKGKLYIISVAEVTEILDTYPPVAEKIEKETRQHLESLKARAEKEGVTCEIIERRGEATYKYIVDEAAKNNVELIIMGRRGRTELKRLTMGSVTAKVIGHASCNVLVIPRAAKLTFEKILVATDGSIYSELASREAISIAKRINGSLVVLSVAKKDENLTVAKESVNMISKTAEKEGIKAEVLTLKGTPFEIIVNTAEQKNAGLIVVGSHGRSGIEKLFMGSVTERIIGHTGQPVLVVVAKKSR